jgi:hypothetical protein
LLTNLHIKIILMVNKAAIEVREGHKANGERDMKEIMEVIENGIRIAKRESIENMWTWIILITKPTRLFRIQKDK